MPRSPAAPGLNPGFVLTTSNASCGVRTFSNRATVSPSVNPLSAILLLIEPHPARLGPPHAAATGADAPTGRGWLPRPLTALEFPGFPRRGGSYIRHRRRPGHVQGQPH